MKKLEKYSSYKDSAVEWIGKIPEHWEVKKLKYALKFTTGGTPSSRVEKYYNGEEPWVTIADMTGRYIEKSHFISKKAVRECNMQIVPKNSLLYSFKLSVGQVAFTKEGIYTNEAIASFYPSKNIDLNFWYYVLPIFLIKNANTNIYGAFLLNQDLIKNALIIFPPKEEQTKIASYLDEKIAKIDTAISGKEKLIELLKEQKKIIINDAVTKGLNKNTKFKDSGVEWIGQTPKHWEVKKLKFVMNKIQTGSTPSTNNKSFFNGNLNWFNPKDLNQEILKESENKLSHLVIARKEIKLFPKDSVLIVGIGATTGKTSYLSIDSTFNQQITGFHSDTQNNKFLFYVFNTLSGVFLKVANYTTLPILNNEFFKSFFLLLPPQSEQEKIVEYIENKTTKIDNVVKLQENYIEKLKEYKTTLIDSVVTGKVKV